MRRHCLFLTGALVLAALAGCSSGETIADGAPTSTEPSPTSSGPTSPAEQSPTAQESSTPAEQAVEVTVSVRDGTVTPPTRRVEVARDSLVRLLVTSDVDDEVHVHGYEVEGQLEAGRTATVELVAAESGVFAVETHDSGLELLQLEVR